MLPVTIEYEIIVCIVASQTFLMKSTMDFAYKRHALRISSWVKAPKEGHHFIGNRHLHARVARQLLFHLISYIRKSHSNCSATLSFVGSFAPRQPSASTANPPPQTLRISHFRQKWISAHVRPISHLATTKLCWFLPASYNTKPPLSTNNAYTLYMGYWWPTIKYKMVLTYYVQIPGWKWINQLCELSLPHQIAHTCHCHGRLMMILMMMMRTVWTVIVLLMTILSAAVAHPTPFDTHQMMDNLL